VGSCCVPRTIPHDRPRPRHVLKGHSSIAQTARGHRPPGLCVQIHTLQRMNLPSPSLAAAPLTARDAVDPRHVHEQPDKPVPGPSHVRNGQSLSAQGSPHSGYPGDPSPPKGLASTGHHPEPPSLSPISNRPPRTTPARPRHDRPREGSQKVAGGRAQPPPPVTAPIKRLHPEGGARQRGSTDPARTTLTDRLVHRCP
jgi:hypothetical protein